MKKALKLFFTLIFCLFLFSCGGGGGGADNAIEDTAFTLGYNANGAESGIAPAAQNGNGKASLAVSANTGNLAKNGYLFDGWNTQPDGYGADYAPGASYTGKKNITLYAKWARLFNYNVNQLAPAPALDGVQRAPGNLTATITGLTNRGQTLSDITIPRTIDGYTVAAIGDNAFQGCTNMANMLIPDTVTDIGDNAFNGCSNLSGVTMQGTVPPTLGTDAFAGCVLLAVSVPQSAASAYNASPTWSTVAILAPGTFSILYDGNGADGGIVPSRQIGIPGISLNIYGNNGSLTRTGCTFNGWNDKVDGTGHSYVENTPYAGPNNMTLYAQWTHPDYIVTFDDQGATTPVSPSTIKVQAPANTIGSLPSTPPQKVGYYFAGWNTRADGTGDSFVIGSQVISNKIVYAKWIENATCTVTFNSLGATTPAYPGHKDILAGTTVDSLPTNPIKEGHVFIGWNTQMDGLGIQFTEQTVVTENITVYAQYTTNNYIIIYNGNGNNSGSVPTSQSGDYGCSITLQANTGSLVKNGYTFNGWNTKADGSGTSYAVGSTYIISGNATMYALWTPKGNYTITYDGNGNTSGFVPASQIDCSDTVITIQSNTGNLSKTGYTFSGWNTKSDGSGTNYVAGSAYTISGNATLYALWLPNQYTVTYNGNGNTSGSIPETQSGDYGSSILLQTNSGNLTKTGCTLGGWNTKADGTGTTYALGSVYTINGDMTLFANWVVKENCTITYNGNGNSSGSVPASQSDYSGTVITLQTNTGNLTKTGYTFGGWNTKADGSGLAYTAGASYTINSNMTLYAQWNPNIYIVSFKGNGNTGGTAPASQTFEYGSRQLLSREGTLTRDNYEFLCWNTKADGTGTDYLAGAAYTINENITLYAIWGPKTYYITYDGNGNTGGSIYPNKFGAPYGYNKTLLDSGNLVKTGYIFSGWNTKADGSGTNYAAGSSYIVREDITLYAKWTLIVYYTITYDGNGKTSGSAPLSQTDIYNSNITLSDSGDMIKTGYTFGGWNTKADGSGINYAAGSSYIINSNMTLYAQWVINRYTINYDGNGNTGGTVPSSQTANYNTYINLQSNTGNLTKNGCTFAGWASDPIPQNSVSEGSRIKITQDLTCYAAWAITITHDGNGNTSGSAPGDRNWYSGWIRSMAGRGSLEREGYAFTGWNTKPDGSGISYTPYEDYSLTQSVTLYAQWVRTPNVIVNNNYDDCSVSADKTNNVTVGETVTLTVSTAPCYKFVNISVKDSASHTVNLTTVSAGKKYTFIMPSDDVTVNAEFDRPYSSVLNNGVRVGYAGVGDIVLASGNTVSASKYNSNYNSTDGTAVGVVAYKGYTNHYGKSGKTYMVSLSYGTVTSWGDRNYGTSETTGENNWQLIKNQDSTAADNPSKYPAFNYANNYSVTGYTNGWFLPSKAELEVMIRGYNLASENVNTSGTANRDIINNGLIAAQAVVGARALKLDYYPNTSLLSSTRQKQSSSWLTYGINVDTGETEEFTNATTVRVIHALDD